MAAPSATRAKAPTVQ